VDDPREDVAPEAVRPEGVFPARWSRALGDVLRQRVAADERGADDGDRDHQSEEGAADPD
jgi:hypothetical protein